MTVRRPTLVRQVRPLGWSRFGFLLFGYQSCSLISLSSMSSRSAYTAITPHYATFPTPHSPIPSGLNPSSSRLQSEGHETSSPIVEEGGSIPSRIHSWLASAKEVVQRNTGLLLFIASQAFFSFMNIAVKILNTIDPPVTALEVCLLLCFLNSSI